MSFDFAAASAGLEQSVEWISCARHLSEQGKVVDAYAMLQSCAQFGVLCQEAVNRAKDDLARVADGETFLDGAGRGKALSFVSSHHLALYIVQSLELATIYTLPPEGHPGRLETSRQVLDACHNLISLDTSQLRAKLIRERAKLLERVEREPEPSNGNDVSPALKGPLPRLRVDLARKTITLDGTPHDIDSSQALRWIKVLSDHPHEWISGKQLENYDPELTGVRTHTLRQFLPNAVLAMLDSQIGKGSRLRM